VDYSVSQVNEVRQIFHNFRGEWHSPFQICRTQARNAILALVGGHAATRQAVIQELREQYHLDRAIEIAPSSEERSSGSTVRSKIGDCRLIVLITGYMGHDLSTIVSNLKQEGALTGEVLPLACRGKSGVVREILNWWIKQKLR
jgi:hypothetical protein